MSWKSPAARLQTEAMLVGGSIYAITTAQPGDELAARSAVVADLERLAAKELPPSEVESARAMAIVHSQSELQSQTKRARAYVQAALAGLQGSTVDELTKRISAVTAEDVRRLAARYFKSAGFRTGVIKSTHQSPR
jgi:predicted Zn-dependent peptidase